MENIQNSGRLYGKSYESVLEQITDWLFAINTAATEKNKSIVTMSHSILHYNSIKGGHEVSGYEGSAIAIFK
jgi:hypothetical protein